MLTLAEISARIVCSRIDHYLEPYIGLELSFDERPTFGDLAQCSPVVSQRIIEYLILAESLQPFHLLVLLDKRMNYLPCKEYSYFSPFTPQTLNVISRRCQNFREIHCHWNLLTINDQTQFCSIVGLINESLMRMSSSITLLDFTDASVSCDTLRIICFSFVSLRFLCLHQASIEKDGLDHLIHPDNVIKSTVEYLTIAKTLMPLPYIVECMIQYTNLKHFRSDYTVAAYLSIEQTERRLPTFFKTVILNNIFEYYLNHSYSEYTDKVRNILQMFPYVNHAIFTLTSRFVTPFVNKLILMMNITTLALSCFEVKEHYEFLELKPSFDNDKVSFNLTSLTLECFLYVDLFYLGERCTNLKKLILINNTYNKVNERFWEKLFYSLKEFELMFISEVERITESLENFHMDYNTLFAVMSSNQLERVVILNQIYFGKALLISLSKGHLQNLKDLFFYTCRKVEIDVLLKIFQTGIKIKRLEYSTDSVNPGVTARILEFIRVNNYETLVYEVGYLPYWLRWSLVSIECFKKNLGFGNSVLRRDHLPNWLR